MKTISGKICKLMTLCLVTMFAHLGASCKNDNNSQTLNQNQMEKILFINGSPNRDGNTATLAGVLLEGKRLFFVYQGASPTKMMLDDGEYTMRRFSAIYNFVYEGMANDGEQAERLREKLK